MSNERLLQHIRPVAPSVPVLNPFPLATRIQNTRAVLYVSTDEARIERAAALVLEGIHIVMLLKVLAA